VISWEEVNEILCAGRRRIDRAQQVIDQIGEHMRDEGRPERPNPEEWDRLWIAGCPLTEDDDGERKIAALERSKRIRLQTNMRYAARRAREKYPSHGPDACWWNSWDDIADYLEEAANAVDE